MNYLIKKKWQMYLKAFGFRDKRIALLEGQQRTEEFVKKEYKEVWGAYQKDLYNFTLGYGYVELNGRIVFQTALEDRRLQLEEFAKVIASTQPKTVLEIGAGSGLNLICLAILFPHIRFTGVELTREGFEAFEAMLANPPLKVIQYLTGVSDIKIPRINFIVQSMLELPFDDQCFDLTYSSMSIEQIPRDYKQVFKEAKRVTKDWCVFYEGFEDFQNFFQKMYRRKVDYFRGNTATLRRIGFKIISVRIPFSHIIYTNAFVICKI
jgi:SAM-dependent methyltransferase